MNEILRMTVLVLGTAFACYNFYLLIKKNLSERIVIIWMLGCGLILLIAAFPRLLTLAAKMVGVDYPPSLLYLIAILVLLTLSLYQSIQISLLERKLREIGGRLALLEYRISASSPSLDVEHGHAWEERDSLDATNGQIVSDALDPGSKTT